MKKFYRPSEINTKEFEAIIEGMRQNLDKIVSDQAGKDEIIECAKDLCNNAKDLEKDPRMTFWGFDEPGHMSSDVRCPYFYFPSYVATCILANAKMKIADITAAIPEFDTIFKKALLGSTARSFHDENGSPTDALILFIENGMQDFLKEYPDYCKEFTTMYYDEASHVIKSLEQNNSKFFFDSNYKCAMKLFARRVEEYYNGEKHIPLFVYGTLMRDRSNHNFYLDDDSFVSTATLQGYDIYDLGSFPGIIKSEHGIVRGELYFITEKELDAINNLESEGSLYIKEEVHVRLGEVREKAFVYVYNHSVEGLEKLNCSLSPWGYDPDAKRKEASFDKDEYVWYVSYGSNMLEERFLCYIKGGKFRLNNKHYSSCEDKSLPVAKMPYILPYEMYYANESSAWKGKGVSFLDISQPGKAYGVAYLIKKSQFDEVCKQENGTKREIDTCTGWYDTVVSLGHWDDIEVKTLTNHSRRVANEPSGKYLQTLKEGLQENYPYLNGALIEDYLH